MIMSFAEIVGLWGEPRFLAGDIGAPANTVSKWGQRDFIPPEWWKGVAAAAVRRAADKPDDGFELVTVERMAALAEKRRPVRVVDYEARELIQ